MVMQRTLLCGKPIIDAKTACDKMQTSRSAGRKALPQPSWIKVMEVGAITCSVVRFADRKLYMKEIPQDGPG
eukprot:8294219-Karenia_brevis.AAC.1